MGRIGTKVMPLHLSYILFVIVMLAPTFVYGANKGEALVDKYRVAHQSRDVKALKALVHWAGGTERTQEIIEQRLNLHLNLKIRKIEIRSLSGDEEFDKLGYRPNLVPVGWLTIFFEPPQEDSRLFAKSFVVGEKDGEYFISIAEPAH
ncbi:MAG: hypothetical protein ACN4GW_08965 [Desulforhopalus sp.]